MAEALARRVAAEMGMENMEVGSAGLAAWDGAPASSSARRAMEARGTPMDAHRARLLTPELAAWADLILVMTGGHAETVARLAPDARLVWTLGEFAGEAGDVDDPYGGSDEVYERCAKAIETLVVRALGRIRRKDGGEAPEGGG
jgi:protein-tyrosine-phosphatase